MRTSEETVNALLFSCLLHRSLWLEHAALASCLSFVSCMQSSVAKGLHFKMCQPAGEVKISLISKLATPDEIGQWQLPFQQLLPREEKPALASITAQWSTDSAKHKNLKWEVCHCFHYKLYMQHLRKGSLTVAKRGGTEQAFSHTPSCMLFNSSLHFLFLACLQTILRHLPLVSENVLHVAPDQTWKGLEQLKNGWKPQ